MQHPVHPLQQAASAARHLLTRLHHRRCGVLLGGLMLFFLVLPLVYESIAARVLLFAFYVALMIGVVWSIRAPGWTLGANVGLGVAYFLLVSAGLAAANTWLLQAGLVAAMLFLAGVILALLGYVMDFSRVTADKLFGAVAIYVLLAFLFSDLYLFMENINPGNFNFVAGQSRTLLDWSDFIYFSFTVLTSTGFGEITPASRLARSIVIIHQVVGVMYVAFLIARLTELYPSRER